MKVGVYIHDGFTFAPRAECPYYWDGAASERFLDWLDGPFARTVATAFALAQEGG